MTALAIDDFFVKVAILDRDPITGRILERLLRVCDYEARHIDDNSLEEPGAFEGIRVVLLGTGWDAERWKNFAEKTINVSPGEQISFLKLGDPVDEAVVSSENYVSWPCRGEDLRLRIEAARDAKPGTKSR